MDVLKAMRVFVSIVESGSLAAAAERQELSATMIGTHLQALEKRMGVKLLSRTTRRQTLTDFGATYYDRCVDILALIDDADALALATQTVPKGRLRVTAPSIFATECLVPALAEYAKRHQEVELDVVVSDAVIDLIEGGFDAAIRIGNPVSSDLIARPLAPYEFAICAAPGYLLAHGTPVEAEDLGAHQCLAYSFSSHSEWRSRQTVWELKAGARQLSIPVSSRFKIDNAAGLRRAALAGMGIAMLPRIMLADDIEQGRLVQVLPDISPPSRPLSLLYLRDHRMSPKLCSFIDFMLEHFGAHRSPA